MEWFRSLPVRGRLTVWYVLALAVVLLLFIAATSAVLYWQLNRQLTHFAIQDIETVEGLLFFTRDGRLSMREDYHYHPGSRQLLERLVEILSPDGAVLYRNERLGNASLGGAPFQGEGVDRFSERTLDSRNGRISLVSRYYPLQGKPLIIRLGYRQDTIWSRIDEFLTAALTALPVILTLAALLGYQLVRRVLSPLEQMAQQAEQITADKLHRRLPIENPTDELGHLARVFNNVLDRLELSFEHLRRFTSNASHELRTPLASIRSVGEVGLQKARSAGDYQETIGSMLEEVARLTRLVESLLTISRADAGQLHINVTNFCLMDLVKEVAALLQVLIEERKQSLVISGDERVMADGDRLLLRQAVINILHNAVKYSPAGGAISVWSGLSPAGRAVIRVTDSGPGIAAEHRDRVFDRFYRVDSGRTREAGGTGLGLSIANWAVEAQGGAIHIEDSLEGAAFSIELPAVTNARQ